MGLSSVGSSIANCYATANVKADHSYGRAGGIVGNLDAGCSVKYCYATGSVEGRDISGISGYGAGTTDNSVALNTSITATTLANRVCNSAVTGTKNYARSNMPGTWTDKDPDKQNGADVSPGIATTEYNNQTWWTTAGNWSGGAWDFTTIWEMSNGNNTGSLPLFK